jgi:hypothetical protein
VRPLIAVLVLLFFSCSLQAAEKKHFVLYAMFVANTDVHLADGTHWIMDKGDTFPVLMFKEQQTKVVLQLAGTNFLTDAVNVMIIQEKDVTEKQLASYRENVQHYLDGRAEKWKVEHQVK